MRHIAVAALAILALACGPLRRGGEPQAVLIFDNRSLNQADVFAVTASGNPIRIGTVFPGSRDRLRVPASALGGGGSLTIVARILASNNAPSTGPVTLFPGDTLEVTLPTDERVLTVLPAREP